MSKTFHHGERRIRVEGVRRETPDLRRLARALIDLAQAEAAAQAEHETGGTPKADTFSDKGVHSTPKQARASGNRKTGDQSPKEAA